MTPRVWNRLFLRVLCFISVLVSPVCFAFSQTVLDQILEQSPDTMKIGLMALVAVLVFLLLLIIFTKIQLGSARKEQKESYNTSADKQSLLNDFKVGMLHINQAGEIIFANRVAAFFLGSKEEKLMNRPLIEVFDNALQGSISAALTSNQYVAMQTYVAASKRHLHLGFTQQSDIPFEIRHLGTSSGRRALLPLYSTAPTFKGTFNEKIGGHSDSELKLVRFTEFAIHVGMGTST